MNKKCLRLVGMSETENGFISMVQRAIKIKNVRHQNTKGSIL